ncbi:hypothetical protein [Kitasatospora sp. NPDC088134]|uniref:hypothetical protein n=1 Tax=Kitasatospora sp. NPDC088134 TaxID=3364071 RepID=UPI0037FBFE6F
MRLKKKLTTALAAAAMVAAPLATSVVTAAPAQATGCLRSIGPIAHPTAYLEPPVWGIPMGTVYMGHNDCTHQLYAEWHVSAEWIQARGGQFSGAIAIWHSGTPYANYFGSTSSSWIDTPMVSDYTAPSGDRAYGASLTVNTPNVDGSPYVCTINLAGWNLSNGTPLGSINYPAPSACS